MICLNSRYRADHARQHDVLAGRRVDTRGEKLRRRQNHRNLCLDVLETAEFAFADIALVGRHAAGIVRIIRNEVGVEIGERTTHLACMLLVHAEHDRLCEAIGLREEMREVARDRFGARAQRDDALEILGVILIVGNLAPEAIEFAFGWSPPRRVIVRDDTVYAVGRQKSVRDALRQGVGVERRAEVGVGVPVVFPSAALPSCRADRPARNSSECFANCCRRARCRGGTHR